MAVLPAFTSSSAAADTTILYVNNAAGSNCSDSGTGTQAVPFCRIAPAAAVVMPGQTVQIAAGSYNDTAVTITRSGTATAPITFRGPDRPPGLMGGTANIDGGAPNYPDFGLVIKGAQHLRIKNLNIQSNQKQSILVDNAQDVSITGVMASGGSVHITGNSSGVLYGQGQFAYAGGPLIQVDGGSTGTVVTTNMVLPNGTTDQTGIQVSDAPGTVIVSNTVNTGCSAGIVLTGGSTGAVIENNVVDTSADGKACPAASSDTGISVSQDSATGAKADYNTISPKSGGAAYNWNGKAYTTQQDFTTATGQGSHDYVSDPNRVWQHGRNDSLSPIVDSADENAPGMLSADAWGQPPTDDPAVPNLGTGSGYRDRGAAEFTNFGSVFTPAGPIRLLDTRVPIGVPKAAAVPAWSTVDLPVTGIAGVPATGVTAVTMNVTVSEPGTAGHLTIFPHGDAPPNASNLNWTAGETIPNLVTVPVKDGKVSFLNASDASIQLIADLAGYYSATGQSTYQPNGPTRMMDTRQITYFEDGTNRPAGAVPAWGTVDISLTELPLTVTSVTLNVTATEPGTAGHLTVYPHGDAPPDASNLNWTAGETIPNLVTVPVKDGKVSFLNASDAGVQLVVDLFGYQYY